jgi:hypothetical protein
VRNRRNGQVLLGGSGGKRDSGLNVLGFQAREIGKNVLGGISVGQGREYGAQSDARPLEDRLSAADSSITGNALFVGFQVSRAIHGTLLDSWALHLII